MHVINEYYFVELYSLKEEVCSFRKCRVVAIRSINISDYVLDVELVGGGKKEDPIKDLKPKQVVKTITV